MDKIINAVLIGSESVGKSNICLQLEQGLFRQSWQPTIGSNKKSNISVKVKD